MKIINNKCSNCGHDGIRGWLMSNPVICPSCGQSEEVERKPGWYDETKQCIETNIHHISIGVISKEEAVDRILKHVTTRIKNLNLWKK